MKTKILSLVLCLAMCLGVAAMLASCGGEDGPGSTKRPDALVLMTEELDGLFNPFYSTTANDGTIVSMTQIGMITTGLDSKGDVTVAYGDNEAVVVKDLDIVHNDADDTTTYTFVIKNGIKFSDGKPLTMNDILFNLYVYLDPAYSGSSTIYSIDIQGLAGYRTQQFIDDDSNADEELADTARGMANIRIKELLNCYLSALEANKNAGKGSSVDETEMKEAIKNWSLGDGYKEAVSNDPDSVTNDQLLADYNYTLGLFREELERDYASAYEQYRENPYKAWDEKSTGIKFDEIVSFMMYEGYVEIEYEKDPVTNKDLKDKIKDVKPKYPTNITTKEQAIQYVYNDTIWSKLDMILQWWATAQELLTEYTSKATELILHKNMPEDGLLIENISGIVSLGHTKGYENVTEVTVDGTKYAVAHEHNADGTVKNDGEYDVLQIKINGVDPKAIWSFGFAVAPQHYYAKGYTVDIANNNFGVEFASHDFMTNVIQAPSVTKVPMGAGAYKATDSANNDNPIGTEFYKDNVVYFKANENFLLGTPKTAKIRYQVVSSSNALNALEAGTVHYVTPQLTDNNIKIIEGLADEGIKSMYTDQLGYGYIGINAGKVPNINIRKAIMVAMDTSLALAYYRTGTASQIFWPMSKVSWAYPKADANYNEKDYPMVPYDRAEAKDMILQYMEDAGVSAGSNDLKIKFTIAGSNLTDHPTYNTFQAAADLLNECGWQIEVVSDTQALTKLSTGSLSVWAAAWGSTVDPDLYQVYHKNSTATSTLAWGYREILNNPGLYSEENDIINKLSDLIDQARETEDRDTRTALYQTAMGYILDLAVELPVYQRSVLYAYNSSVIKESSLPSTINPYSSPLDRIWEIELVD